MKQRTRASSRVSTRAKTLVCDQSSAQANTLPTTRATQLTKIQRRMRRTQMKSSIVSAVPLIKQSLSKEMLKKEQPPTHKLFHHLNNHFQELKLPGEMWVKYQEPGSHILFAKGEPDFQLSFKVVIYSDMKVIISYYGKVLTWLEADIKSEGNLEAILRYLHTLKLPKFHDFEYKWDY